MSASTATAPSTDVDTAAVSDRDRVSIKLPQVFGGLAVAALIGGAVAVASSGGGGAYADPGAYIQDFYATQDASGMVQAFVTDAFATQQLEGLEGALSQILSPQVTVTDTTQVTVRGVPLGAVTTSDSFTWCVRPDGRILVSCRVGGATMIADPGDTGLLVEFSEIDILAEGAQLVLVLSAAGDQAVTITQDVALLDADGADLGLTATEVSVLSGGQRLPAEGTDIVLEPGLQVLFVFDAADAAGRDALLTSRPVLAWGDQAVALTLQQPTFYLR